jgi:hypothetical protein
MTLRQRLIAAAIVVLALYFGVAVSASNSATRKPSKRPQAQLTVIIGADRGLVRIRSTRFF